MSLEAYRRLARHLVACDRRGANWLAGNIAKELDAAYERLTPEEQATLMREANERDME